MDGTLEPEAKGSQDPTAAADEDAAAAQMRAQIDLLVELNSKVFDKAIAYTNVIVLAGYAGLFAIWNFTKDGMTDGLKVWIAFLAGISLTIFVSFEVVKMLLHARTGVRISKLLMTRMAAGEFVEALQAYQAAQHRTMIRFLRFWGISLVATIVPALIAITLLFYAIAVRLPFRALVPSWLATGISTIG